MLFATSGLPTPLDRTTTANAFNQLENVFTRAEMGIIDGWHRIKTKIMDVCVCVEDSIQKGAPDQQKR